MQVVLRYTKDSDQLTARFRQARALRQALLADGVTIGVDDQRQIVNLTIKGFSRFHGFSPLLDLIGTDGIAAISRFQSETRTGAQQRTVTISPKPLSKRVYDSLSAA